MIITYAKRPGEALSVAEIARTLQMSRTPVHQALYRLKHEGFLTAASGNGWRIYSLSISDIREIFALKIVIENLMIAEVAAKESSSKDKIRDCLSKMQRAASERNRDEWIKFDQELHELVFALSSNSRGVGVIKSLNEQWYRFQIRYVPLDLQERQREHNAFVNCILTGDVEGAQRYHEEHLNHLRMEIEYILKKMIFPITNDRV